MHWSIEKYRKDHEQNKTGSLDYLCVFRQQQVNQKICFTSEI